MNYPLNKIFCTFGNYFSLYFALESPKKQKETDLFNGSPEAAYEPTYPQVNDFLLTGTISSMGI